MSKNNAYTGKSGQLAAMGELAWRGYNVALPEMDVGDDIFSVNDANHRIRSCISCSPAEPNWDFDLL